jgi:predicted outer membrane repeat protein
MDTRFVPGRNSALLMAMALATLGMHHDAHALTYLVGGDGACDYSTVQAAINGAASNPGPDSIHIANNAGYSQQALSIGSQDLIIEGGYASCASAAPTGITTIDGAGGSAAPVFRISGSGVRDFSNLTIRGGDSSGADYGGGIQFSGSGDLILRNVGVTNNTSSYGGGIYFSASGGPAILTIETNTVVLNNTAQNSGGGIYITGNARLFMLRDRTTVQGNTAVNGDGGGIAIEGPARADIASPGYINFGAVSGNTAVRGGGLAIFSTGNGHAKARFFGIDANRPVRINGNRASQLGGAVWLRGFAFATGGFDQVEACALDASIDGNRASDGAAVYADHDSFLIEHAPGTFMMNVGCALPDPETIESLGRVACATGVNGCNFIANNTNAYSAGAETGGATLNFTIDGIFQMRKSVVIGNVGGNALRGSDTIILQVGSSMIVGNSLSGDVMHVGEDHLVLTDNTIANNINGGATHLIRFDDAGTLEMRNNVIWQPGKLTLLYPGGGQNLSVDDILYNVVSDATTLPQGPFNLQADPQFIDPGLSNYGLRISSPALDFSLPIAGDDRGIDGRPRDQQVRPGPPRERVRDVGALERQPPDPYLINGTFDGGLRLWSNNFPEYTRWNTQDDGAGGVSGSTEMSIPGDETGEPGGIQVASIHGLTQCFAVPWPGAYTLSARGLSRLASLGNFPDTATVNWRLRYHGADCTGPADAEGNLLLPSNPGWNGPLAPSDIAIAQSAWNYQTTLEISAGVLQYFNDPATQNPIFALIDNVVLRYEDDGDRIFADDFD